MRTLKFGGLAAVLAVGLAVDVAKAADGDEDAPKRQSTFNFALSDLWSSKSRSDDVRKIEPARNLADQPLDRPPPVANPREPEFNAYLRRMDACDRLMDIAIASNNEDMQRRVEQLSERVRAVYQKNTGNSAARRPDRNDESLKSAAVGSANGNPRTTSAGRD